MNVSALGRVERTFGSHVVARLPAARIGDGVRIEASGRRIVGSVCAVARDGVTIVPLSSLAGVAVGDRVVLDPQAQMQVLGFGALGRAVDGSGAPIDGGEVLRGPSSRAGGAPPAAVLRSAVATPMWTGIRAIDGLLTIGRGARVGIFGAPGSGKSSLLEAIAGWSQADAVVVALVGERGREAARWLERRNARTTIVCATSDRSAPERVRAAETAMAQATNLRDRGLHVLLVVDSLARYVNALRDVRSGNGEAVGRGGYPPGVFAELARLLERAGTSSAGTVTLICSVLSDGADERDPVSDASRSLLDGHVALSLERAGAGSYPAIDIERSASRTMDGVAGVEHREQARLVRAAIARLSQSRDARELGLLRAADPLLSRAVDAQTAIESFLSQRVACPPSDTLRQLRTLVSCLVEPA